MWQHPSTGDRLDQLERMLRAFLGSSQGSDHSPDERRIFRALEHMEHRIMSALSDKLNAAVAELATNIQSIGDNLIANDTAIQAEIAALKAAVENDDEAAVEAAISKIGDLSTAAAAQAADIKGDTERLTASLPPA